MQKEIFGWSSERLPCPARVVRWGHHGRPVLLFPTAGGDFEEVERHGLIAALAPLIDAGRIKVYSVDSVAGRHWIEKGQSPHYASRVHLPRAGAPDPPGLRVPRDRARNVRGFHRRLQRRGHAVPAPGRFPTRDRDERNLRPVALCARLLERRFLLLLAAALPAGAGRGLADREAAEPHGDPRIGLGPLGKHRRILGDGECARGQGHTESRRRLGPWLRPRLADVVPDAPAVPVRAGLTGRAPARPRAAPPSPRGRRRASRAPSARTTHPSRPPRAAARAAWWRWTTRRSRRADGRAAPQRQRCRAWLSRGPCARILRGTPACASRLPA